MSEKPLVMGPSKDSALASSSPSGALVFPFGKIPRLDFLRAVSAALVVLYHSGLGWAPAGFGVLTFFVISGFLITHLLIKEALRTGTVSIKSFYARRSLRIFPAFLAYWLLVAVARLVVHKPPFTSQSICSLFYVSNYYQGLHGYPSSSLSHTWSLSIEEQFYLLWPFFFFIFRRRLHALATILFFVIPAIWLYRAVLCVHGVSSAYLYTAFETRVDAILVGALFALILQTGTWSNALRNLTLPRFLLPTLALLLLSVFHPWLMRLDYRFTFGYAIEPVLVCLFLLQFIRFQGAGWVDSSFFAFLGKISYSTYLYQQMIHPVAEKLTRSAPLVVTLAVSLLLTWAAASLSFFLVERPALRLKERMHPAANEAATDKIFTTA